MDDKDRALVEQVLHAAGTTGQAGFGYMVRFEIIDGITSFLGWSAVIALAVIGIRKLWMWKAEDEACIVKGAAILALSGILFGAICGTQCGIRSFLAPEGAAIHRVLH